MMNSPFLQIQATLQFFNGPLVGTTVSITKQDTRIGSDPNLNDIVLSDPSIEPQHARIIYVNQGQFIIQSNNSQCIMIVNQQNVAEAVLADQVQVSLGMSGIIFLWMESQEEPTPKKLSTLSQNRIPSQHPSPQQNLPPPLQNAFPPQTPLLSAQRPATPSPALPTDSINAPTETTRYLCAAAHLDEDFREYAIKNVFEEDHRAVGESYGVDIIPVAKWCYTARQRVYYRDLILFIDLLVLLLSLFFPARFPSLFTYIVFIILCFLVAWIVTLGEQIISQGPKAASLAKGRFNPSDNNWPLDPQLEQKLRTVFPPQNGNVVVYSGYSPFAGAGFELDGRWSFAIDISKAKKEIDGKLKLPVAFQVSELYAEIAEMIQQLGLDNVSLEDKLYVNGQSIRDNTTFLPDRFSRPYTQIAPERINAFKEKPSEYIRYYKCIRITSWDGEMVLSLFVRFKLAGKNLFIEADYQLLPPVKEQYHEIDTIEPTWTMPKFLRFARRTFTPSLFLLLRSPYRVCKYWFHDQLLAQRRTKVENSIKENPAFDYGTRSSLREFASSPYYRLYFQRLDKEMYVHIIEHQLLDAITHFLDVRNIDITELKSRQDTILNNGVIVSGGTFSAQNLAVGEKARATATTRTAGPAGGAAPVQSQPTTQS